MDAILKSSIVLDNFKKIPRKDLDCPVACRVVDYNTLLSVTKFPSNVYADKLASNKFQLKGSKLRNRRFIR